MARDEAGRERNPEQTALQHRDTDSNLLDRREYVKLAGASIAALGGLGLGASSAVAEGGPANTNDWQLSFEDTFESNSLDTSSWGVGFGWGRDTTGSPERIVDENVNIENNQLRLKGTHDGSDYKAGGIHSRGKEYFGPGSYWEAKIKCPERVGFLPAFWSKPNSEDWPPEIDFLELFQNDGDYKDTHVSHHNIHYSSSTTSGDGSSHTKEAASYDAGVDLTNDFHVYGCEWQEDRVVHYVDGEKVAECTDSTVMESLRNGAPFYMMLNIHIDRVGTADASESWGEEMVVDWVRVWEHAPNSGSTSDSTTDSTTDSTDSTTDTTTDSDGSTTDTTSGSNSESYLWVRSTDGSEVRYAFEVDGGSIRHDPKERASGENDGWISSDGTAAGGTVSGGQLSGDGFWYEGDISDLTFAGPIETFVDDQRVDPASLAGSSESSLNTITVDGTSASGSVSYAVSVTDSIDSTTKITDGDSVSERSAEGSVSGGTDTYCFRGGLTNLRVDGDADVYVNGTKVDLLRVRRGPDTTGAIEYIVETDGDLIKADVPSASINAYDRTSRHNGVGRVMGGTDAYWVIGGDVLDVSAFGGDALTIVNGTETDLSN